MAADPNCWILVTKTTIKKETVVTGQDDDKELDKFETTDTTFHVDHQVPLEQTFVCLGHLIHISGVKKITAAKKDDVLYLSTERGDVSMPADPKIGHVIAMDNNNKLSVREMNKKELHKYAKPFKAHK